MRADVASVMAEDNLERRSEKALQEAEARFKSAREAYDKGEMQAYQDHLAAVREMAELAQKSLQDSGKAARRSPKYWKRAEKNLRQLYRSLNEFEKDVHVEDRQLVVAVGKRLNEIHDEILLAIMSKR
jgi:hypothetical protein